MKEKMVLSVLDLNDEFRQFLFNELLATLGHDWHKIKADYLGEGVTYEMVKAELQELFKAAGPRELNRD